MKLTAIALLTAVLLTACGQKGALYLPQPANTPAAAPDQPPVNDDKSY